METVGNVAVTAVCEIERLISQFKLMFKNLSIYDIICIIIMKVLNNYRYSYFNQEGLYVFFSS